MLGEHDRRVAPERTERRELRRAPGRLRAASLRLLRGLEPGGVADLDGRRERDDEDVDVRAALRAHDGPLDVDDRESRRGRRIAAEKSSAQSPT